MMTQLQRRWGGEFMIIKDENIYNMIIDILKCGDNPQHVKEVQEWIIKRGLDEVFYQVIQIKSRRCPQA